MAEEKKTSSAAKKENGFVRFMKRAGKFFRDCRGEVKKIVWPTPKATFRNTGIVLATVIVLGLFVFGVDTLFMYLLSFVMDVAQISG